MQTVFTAKLLVVALCLFLLRSDRRTDISLAERAKMMVRRQEIYVEKNPGTGAGGDRRSIKRKQFPFDPPPENFAVQTASVIGKHERVVRLDVQRGADIFPEALDLVTRTPLDKARYLNGLMRSPREEQVERVRRDLAARQADPAPVDPAWPPSPPSDPDTAYHVWLGRCDAAVLIQLVVEERCPT